MEMSSSASIQLSKPSSTWFGAFNVSLRRLSVGLEFPGVSEHASYYIVNDAVGYLMSVMVFGEYIRRDADDAIDVAGMIVHLLLHVAWNSS